MKLVEYIETARKEITMAVFEGRANEAEAVQQLTGLKVFVEVTLDGSKSEKLKTALSGTAAALDATIAKLAPTSFEGAVL